MGRITALTELTTLANDDYLLVVDSSANIAKKITVANAFGIPDFGWTATGETWTYASWSATTRIGTITVPTNATTKYQAGMRIKLTQSTGGTKYGIITKVAATLLTIFFPAGTTLNNEAITTPFYSPLDSPIGFDKDPALWQVTFVSTTEYNQASPTNGTWYNMGSQSLTIGVGKWDLDYFVDVIGARGSAGSIVINATLSTGNNNESEPEFTFEVNTNAVTTSGISSGRRKTVTLAAETTYYLNSKPVVSSINNMYNTGSRVPTTIRARCAYL